MHIWFLPLLILVVSALDNGLAKTPPLGWNSWNRFFCKIDEHLIRATIDGLVSSGLRDAGYKYVNLDDCWQSSRKPDGTIVPDPKAFPHGIRPLVEHAHSNGLLFGLYSDAGFKTCEGRPGSLGFEEVDAATYASWGVDYLKYDNCNTDGTKPEVRYPPMRDALNATGRKIVFSMCEWGVDDPATWARPVANLWRTTGDIAMENHWDGMLHILDQNNEWADYAAPHGWNDPDITEVGNGGLTFDEEVAHFSLWAIVKAPLLIGCDVVNISASTKSILTNPEVLAVNQDELGVQGRRITRKQAKVSMGPEPAPVVIRDCRGAVHQKWTFEEDGSLRNGEGLCLEVPECDFRSGVQLRTAACHIGDPTKCEASRNQVWKHTADLGIVSNMSSKCVDVRGNVAVPGTMVEQYECYPTVPNQRWAIDPEDRSLRSLGRCLTPLITDELLEVWAGPLVNKASAVVLLNRAKTKEKITVEWNDLGMNPGTRANVRDLWNHVDLGVFTGSFTAEVRPHAVVMVKVTPA